MKLLFIITFIGLLGCTSNKPHSKDFQQRDIETISLDENQTDRSKKVYIDKDSSIGYGPDVLENGEDEKAKGKRIPILSLHLMPALYGSYAYITLLKDLEKRDIKPKIIASSGFSTIIAALYAKKASTSYLEWKIYELTSKIKGKTPFTEDWLDIVDSFIDREFKNQNLSQMKSLLVIPKIKKGQVELIVSGKVAPLLKDNLRFNGSQHFFNSPELFSRKLEKIGADIIVNLSAFPRRLTSSSLGDFHWGVYTSYASKIMTLNEDIYHLENDKFTFIDIIKPASTVNSLFKERSYEIGEKVEELYKAWQEEISSSSN